MDFNMVSRLQNQITDLVNIEWPSFDISKIKWSKLPKLRIGDKVAKVPIVQGGMGVGISLSGLSSAVANEGGIGVIAANSIGMLDPDYYARHKDANVRILKKEIREAREKTKGIIGVNIMVAMDDFKELLETAIQEKVDVVFLGAGLPIRGIPVPDIRSAGVKVVPIVSSARAAGLIFNSWWKKYQDIPDGVVVEGPKAGGHLGFKFDEIDDPDFSLERILPDVVSTIKPFEIRHHKTIPVIAAGGVFTGQDIYNMFKLGASGVQMGTRFVATHECDADIKFKKAYIECQQDDIQIIKSPVGLPGRAIANGFLSNVASGKKMKLKCTWKCLKSCNIKTAPYCISLALNNARKGDLDKGFVFAGSNAYRIDKIISVKELLLELQSQYLKAKELVAWNLRLDYEKALTKLTPITEAYLAALKNGLASIRQEYENSIEKRTLAIREERDKIMDKIGLLKIEYQEAKEKTARLKTELMDIFEQYKLLNRANASEA